MTQKNGISSRLFLESFYAMVGEKLLIPTTDGGTDSLTNLEWSYYYCTQYYIVAFGKMKRVMPQLEGLFKHS